MKNFIRWLNKRGISTDVLVIVLLVIGLAIAVILFLTLGGYGKSSVIGLSNLTTPLKQGSGI